MSSCSPMSPPCSSISFQCTQYIPMSLHTHISFHIPCLLIYLLCSPTPSDISLIIFLLNLYNFVCLYPLYNPFPSYIPFVYQSTLHVPAGTSMTLMFPLFQNPCIYPYVPLMSLDVPIYTQFTQM